jgi:DTW domain-containing protein
MSIPTPTPAPPELPCERCRKPRPLCVCDRIPALHTRTEVLILQHPQEPDERLGTAHLTELSLDRARVRVGLSWASLADALGREVDPKGWAVLYTSSLKKPLTPAQRTQPFVLLDRHGDARPVAPGVLEGLVVLDGTWSQAKTLWWRNAWMLKLNRVLLHPTEPSAYGRLRKEPQRKCLATLEAVAEALDALGEDPAIKPALKRLFRTLLQRARDDQAAHETAVPKARRPGQGRALRRRPSHGGGPLD